MMKNKPKKNKKNETVRRDRPNRPKNQRADIKNKPKHANSLIPRPNLYGIHAVREAWLNKDRNVHGLYITENALHQFEDVVKQGVTTLHRPQPRIVDKTDMDAALPGGAVHQGVALACSDLPEREVEDIVIRSEENTQSTIAILDQITDPHNVGAIIRSASALGLDAIIMQRRHAPELSGVLAKTACGALEYIDIAQATNLARAIETLKLAGFFIIGLDERGDDLGTIKRHKKTAIILGAEGPGIRRLIKEGCDTLASIPMSNTIASINVSNAAAIAFYALKS